MSFQNVPNRTPFAMIYKYNLNTFLYPTFLDFPPTLVAHPMSSIVVLFIRLTVRIYYFIRCIFVLYLLELYYKYHYVTFCTGNVIINILTIGVEKKKKLKFTAFEYDIVIIILLYTTIITCL